MHRIFITNRAALKTKVFHLSFNLLTVIMGLLLSVPFIALIQRVSGETDIKNQIANAHVLFNVLGVLAFIGFVPFFEKFLNWLIPEKDQKTGNHLQSALLT